MLILFGLLLPFAEIYLLVVAAKTFGFLSVLGMVLLSTLWGLNLVRSQGFKTIMGVQQRLAEGKNPQMDLLDGTAVVLGGLLLIIPGFITTTLGLLCIFPLSRSALKYLIQKWALKKVFKNRNYQAYRNSQDSNSKMKDINSSEV